MIEIRIRHQDEVEGAYLTYVPFDQLDTLIPTIRQWGLYGDQTDEYAMSGQFVHATDSGSAYFEVVVEDLDIPGATDA